MRARMFVAAAALGAGACASEPSEPEHEGPGEEAHEPDSGASITNKTDDLKVEGFAYTFQNWDYDGTHVDNPVSLLFVSNRPDLVDRVYAQIEAESLTGGGGKMNLSGVGGSRPGVSSTDTWHSESAGRKGAFGCWGNCDPKTDIHVRTYGPDGREGTQVYQADQGIRPYYLVATVHFDVNENTPTASFGYQDDARTLLVDHMKAVGKWRVLKAVDTKNACDGKLDAKHICDHDGTALVIDID